MVVLPPIFIYLAFDEKFTQPNEMLYAIIASSLLFFFNFAVVQIGFWEKMFASIFVSEEEIVWRCPLRAPRKILADECLEIGGFWEHENNGIPVEQIYFSHIKGMELLSIRKVMRRDKKIIVFWYSEELYRHIKRTFNSNQTGRLVAHRVQRQKQT